MWTRRSLIKTAALAPLALLLERLAGGPRPARAAGELSFSVAGSTSLGKWSAEVRISPSEWTPGCEVSAALSLKLDSSIQAGLRRAGWPMDALAVLMTSERCFDHEGWHRLPCDELMSTLLTPSGLAIEGGSTGDAISVSTGSNYRNPVDLLGRVPARELVEEGGSLSATVSLGVKLPEDTPPGVYRLRFDLGAFSKGDTVSLSGERFADRPFDQKDVSLFYSPILPCSGPDVSGRFVDGAALRRRIYWVLLAQYNANGFHGAIAEEDAGHFALSDRNTVPDEVVLPLNSYSLEPQFPADTVDPLRNIPWAAPSGELSISVTDPSGRTVDLGTAPFTALKRGRPTTGDSRFTSWRPQGYGHYTVAARGWIADRWGNRYEGGGTYRFWIAERMTLATAVFQGQPFPVGARYGRDLAFAPPLPAEVTVSLELYAHSDPGQVKRFNCSGRANQGGVFGAAQGLESFTLDAPGEYSARMLAIHLDGKGTLWVCSMRHAGVVYPTDSPIVARGKKFKLPSEDQMVERGQKHLEGFEKPSGEAERDHIPFPYNPGDVLLMSSDGLGANRIESVLTWAPKDGSFTYEPGLEGHGATNLRMVTSNGMSPHLYPEYITDLGYYYAAGPRPGFSCAFMVAEDRARFPYWPTSDTNCGAQIGASTNGDMPGTIYRLLGGVVLRPQGERPLYAGYVASAFVLPAASNNNRVVEPGSEDMPGPNGRNARFFLVAPRPGMVYEQGAAFAPAFQIDPILPARVRCDLLFQGSVVKSWEGTADANGTFAGAERFTMEQPGLYSYRVKAEWEGHQGFVPGLPEEGGYLYVVEKQRPAGAPGLKLLLDPLRNFDPRAGLMIEGNSSSTRVHYAAITPGVVLEQGEIPVEGGRFSYRLDPMALSRKMPFYDIANRRRRETDVGRVIHLTFFARETAPGGAAYHSFARVIVRGTRTIYLA